MEQQQTQGFDSWAIVELMGHVKIAGRVTEEERFGAKMGRIDIPTSDGKFATQYFGGSSVYRMTPTTEDVARAVAKNNQPTPVYRWELPAPPAQEQPRSREQPSDFGEASEGDDSPCGTCGSCDCSDADCGD